MDIRKIVRGTECKISYLRGMVSEHEEGLAGHHSTYTLAVVDEASSVSKGVYDRMSTWAKRMLLFGNPYGSAGSLFYDLVKTGDIEDIDD
jgi:hypothetical protein